MRKFAHLLSIAIVITSLFSVYGEVLAIQAQEDVIRPEECIPALPTPDDAVARLRAIGVPEQSPPGPSPTAVFEDPYLAPVIPAGRAIDDRELRERLISTIRRWMACQYHDSLLTFVEFSTDETLRRFFPSVASFQEAVAGRTDSESNADNNRISQQQSLLETFGARQLEENRFGLFAIRQIRAHVSGATYLQHFADFFVISQEGDRFYLDIPISLGTTCQFAENAASPGPASTPVGGHPEFLDSCLEILTE
jgi:hypothetical protein